MSINTTGAENWKWIPGYEGLYKISSEGNIITYHRDVCGVPLKTTQSKLGYCRVLLRKNGSTKAYNVHRLILLSFVSTQNSKMMACHINGKPYDNRLENLRWGTAKENSADAIRHGTTARGERGGTVVMSEENVREARVLYATGNYTFAQLADLFAVSKSGIKAAVGRSTWAHLSSDSEYKAAQHFNSIKLSSEHAIEIRNKYSTGDYTMEKLAEQYSVSLPCIEATVRKSTYKEAGGADCSGVTGKKLSAEQATEIRIKFSTGTYTPKNLAAQYGVTGETIRKIIRNIIYPDVGGPVKNNLRHKIITQEQRLEIAQAIAQNTLSRKQIEEKYSISAATISRIANNKQRNKIAK
jgi:hypothetical protein